MPIREQRQAPHKFNQILFKDGYYTFPAFLPLLLIAFNNRNLDLEEFLERVGIKRDELFYLDQVHGDGVIVVKKKDRKGKIPKKDALITAEKNLPIGVFTADCLPVFLYDIKRKVIALIHAGRKGTEKEITKKTILKMKKEFRTNPKDLKVVFGPAIRSCCYEIDLIGSNINQLIQVGVNKENIFDSGICTSCRNEEFFSYRKEGKFCGRMLSVMMLR
jgi:copper oxidase (laccase) domain-containing protein